ncbi:MAG: RNA polymerase sigma factor [Bacteroidota bacterium]
MQKAAFTSEISNYSKTLKPYAMNLTRSVEDTEDLIQDTMIKALVNFDKFQEGTNLKAWLYTIMKNIFINNYRKKSKFNFVRDESENGYMINLSTQKTYNLVERYQLHEELTNVIDIVDKNLSTAFVMHYEGVKYEEISEKLKLPLGTVKSRIFLAKKKMQTLLVDRGIDSTYKIAS